jgi:hypothetical protein
VERAIEEQEPIITTLKVWPVFDPLRSHPRYPTLPGFFPYPVTSGMPVVRE